MKKIFLFSSKYCNDCTAMKEFLSKNNINYINMDITENLLFLKMFLKYRDNNAAFNEIKEKGSIGIPCILINEVEKFFFCQDTLNLNELK
jgi:glutaredoxin-related protein